MARKTNSELEHEVILERIAKRERGLSDIRYAKILVEKIVFGFVGIILAGLFYFEANDVINLYVNGDTTDSGTFTVLGDLSISLESV